MSDGFSDNEVIGVGAFYGLRWFTIREDTTPQLDDMQMAELNDLRDRRIKLWTAAQRLTGRAVSQERQFNGHEQELYDGLNAKMDALDALIKPLTESDHPELVLAGTRDVWQPGRNHAICLSGHGHEVPHANNRDADPSDAWCGCGYWAYWDLGNNPVDPPSVVGLVKGWGRLIEGDLGFRCSDAEIIAIWMPTYATAEALELEARYRVPVYKTFGTMKIMFDAEHPDLHQPPLTNGWLTNGGGATWTPVFAQGGVLPAPSGAGGGGGGGNAPFQGAGGGGNSVVPGVHHVSVRLSSVIDQLQAGIEQLKKTIHVNEDEALKTINSLIALIDAYNRSRSSS